MKTLKKLTAAAVTGAAYAALTMFLAPFSYGVLQLRISEALCILPFFMPCTAWGLFAGCALANLMSPAGVLDVVFGSLATLLAAGCTALLGAGGQDARLGRCAAACAMPVVWNGLMVGGVLAAALHDLRSWPLFGFQVAAGEAAVLFVVGLPLMRALRKIRPFLAMTEQVNGRRDPNGPPEKAAAHH